MGEVYRATNVAIGRTVAIKLLLPHHATDEKLTARILTEARAAAIVRHPNVVDVLDIGQEENGAPFIVQELLEGKDLAHYVVQHGKKISQDVALRILIPVVEAVAAAHAKGVVHRDLKPANVFLAKSERGEVVPKLLDFGISQVRAHENVRITETGVAMGTPAYMSPEQVMGTKDIDARADVWALGVILYELLAGRLPFHAAQSSAMFVLITTASPAPLEEIVPTVTRDLARVVRRCLRKNRNDRYTSADELAYDLKQVASGKHVASVGELPVAAPVQSPSLPTVPQGGRRRSRAQAEPPRREQAQRVAGGFVELPGEAGGKSGLKVATIPPPPAPEDHSAEIAEHEEKAEVSKLTGALVLGVVIIGTGVVLTLVNPIPDGWPVRTWATTYLGTMPGFALAAIAASTLFAAAMAVMQGVRSKPISWGHIVASAGLLGVTALVAADAFGDASLAQTLLATCFPIATALVPFGFGIFGLRKAWEAWKSEGKGAAATGVALALLVGLVFFATLEVVRGP
jgi:serine/threonine-protein kinase